MKTQKKKQKLVRGVETRNLYRVVREYKHVLLVKRADSKWALPFTVPREWMEPVAGRRG